MDPASYKDFTTSRGIKYHYFASPARDGKPTLVFCHGFPSTSYDWHNQVAFFAKEGYGLIVPDCLGYGGTDKPTTPESYAMKLMTKDLAEILDAENQQSVIIIGHDWGSALVSRFCVYHTERVVASAYLAAPYMAPDPSFDINKVLELTKQVVGYPLYGYWLFLNEDDAGEIMNAHIKSGVSILFPSDPVTWKTDVCPPGALKRWLLEDRVTPPPAYIAENLQKHIDNIVTNGGFVAPTCWYKAVVRRIFAEEEKDVPVEKYANTKPVFFGACAKDYICVPVFGKMLTQQLCPNATVVDFDSDHWVQLAVPDKLNEELLKWITSLDGGQN